MAFNTTPSDLHRNLFWTVTHHDIRTKTKLYIGEQHALVVQNFQTLEKVVSLAFGSEKQEEKPPEPKTKAELKSKFRSIFG